MDTPKRTLTLRLAATNKGRSRFTSVPLVRMEKGVRESASAAMMSGISR